MTKDHTSTDPRIAMRRKDRAVTDDAWIRAFLAKSQYGVLATVADGQPFVHTNTFVYDEDTHTIYLHTAGEFSVEYESVVIFGRGSIMTDLELAREKMQLLMDKYFGHLKPGADYRAITGKEIAEISVFQLAVDAWSAKQKLVEDNFPGAFWFGQPPQDTEED